MAKIIKQSIFLSLLIFALACEEKIILNSDSNNKKALNRQNIRGEIFEYMKWGYLWNYKMPTNIDTTEDVDSSIFFYNLLYTTLDKWSFMVTKEEMENLDKGIFTGHGIMFNLDEYGNFRVAFVYENTTAWAQGIKRGWILMKINGEQILNYDHLDELIEENKLNVTNEFEFIIYYTGRS